MLEAMATLILVIVGAALVIVILGFGIYITFYPLTKTIKGGIDAMKEHAGEDTKKGEEDGSSAARGARTGGGSKGVRKKKAMSSKRTV
jgi:hypothetical protein